MYAKELSGKVKLAKWHRASNGIVEFKVRATNEKVSMEYETAVNNVIEAVKNI